MYSLMNVGAFVLGLNMMASPKKGLVHFFFFWLSPLSLMRRALLTDFMTERSLTSRISNITRAHY